MYIMYMCMLCVTLNNHKTPPPPTRNRPSLLLHSFLADEIDIDSGTRLHILSLLEADVPDVVATAAAAGDSATLDRYLSRNPHEVELLSVLGSLDILG